MDLFASKDYKKLPIYASLFNDPKATHIDAFSFSWPSNIHAFPPIPLISKTISKIIQEQVELCILITPAWNSFSILPVLKNMLIYHPIFIPSICLLGYLPTRYPLHLMAWPISGCCVRKGELARKYLMPSYKASVVLPYNVMPGYGRDLLAGLLREGIQSIYLQF